MASLTTRSEIEISEAIRECVALCLTTDAPLQCIDDFMADLKASGWLKSDLKQFKRGTMYVLTYLQRNDTLFCDTYLEPES